MTVDTLIQDQSELGERARQYRLRQQVRPGITGKHNKYIYIHSLSLYIYISYILTYINIYCIFVMFVWSGASRRPPGSTGPAETEGGRLLQQGEFS